MAVGPDRVQVLKRESAALGGDGAEDADYFQPLNPQEDAIEAAGVYLQDETVRDEEVYVGRQGDDMIFRDKNNTTPLTLSSIQATPVVVDASGAFLSVAGTLMYIGNGDVLVQV